MRTITREIIKRRFATAGQGRSRGASLQDGGRVGIGGWKPPLLAPRFLSLILAMLLLLPLPAKAASVVDWLTYQPGADRAHFGLLDDAGALTAQGEVQMDSGLFAPLSPSAGTLQAPFWVSAPTFTDSVLGNATVATTKVQVAPQAGSVHYRLTLTGTNLAGMSFGLGQLFGTGTTGTRQVNIAGLTAGGSGVPVSLLGFHAWDDGIRF